MVFIYCYLTEGVQRLIIHHALSEMSHSFDPRLNGIVVRSFVFLVVLRLLLTALHSTVDVSIIFIFYPIFTIV